MACQGPKKIGINQQQTREQPGNELPIWKFKKRVFDECFMKMSKKQTREQPGNNPGTNYRFGNSKGTKPGNSLIFQE